MRGKATNICVWSRVWRGWNPTPSTPAQYPTQRTQIRTTVGLIYASSVQSQLLEERGQFERCRASQYLDREHDEMFLLQSWQTTHRGYRFGGQPSCDTLKQGLHGNERHCGGTREIQHHLWEIFRTNGPGVCSLCAGGRIGQGGSERPVDTDLIHNRPPATGTKRVPDRCLLTCGHTEVPITIKSIDNARIIPNNYMQRLESG